MEDKRDHIDNSEEIYFAQKISSEIEALDEIELELGNKYNKYTLDYVKRILATPSKYVDDIQDLIDAISKTNGIIRNILTYKANILTYDHYIHTIDPTKYKSKDKLMKAYIKCAKKIECYNLKMNLPWMIEEIIKNGELYTYTIRSKDSIVIQKIPNKYCKITKVVGGVQKYAICLSKIGKKSIKHFPKEIQDIWTAWDNGKLKNDPNLKTGNYYYLESNDAQAFSTSYMKSKTEPYYTSLLKGISMLGNLEDLQSAKSVLENFKIVVQKVPTDDDGKILMEKNVITAYHNALKKILPVTAGALTSPLDIKLMSLGDANNNITSYIQQTENSIYNNSGVNSDIFNSASKTNTQIAIQGSIVDCLLPQNILNQIAIWLNADMKNVSDTKNFGIAFVNSTKYNQAEKVKSAINNLATWNSRLEVLALMGHTPLQAINILYMESIMELDEIMPQKITAYTSTEEDVGRPTNGESDDSDIDSPEENDT